MLHLSKAGCRVLCSTQRCLIFLMEEKMSGVSSSDRNNATDQVRNARETYSEKEKELVKKQRSEIRRFQAQHDQEVEEIKDVYNKQINDLRGKTKDALTNKDVDNQKKINEMRSVYLDQLRKKTQEFDQFRTAASDAREAELKSQKQVADQQKEVLTRNFKNEIEGRDKAFSTFKENVDRQLDETIEENASRLKRHHEIEKKVLRENNQETRIHLQSEMGKQKKAFEQQLGDERRNHQNEVSRVQSNMMDTIGSERKLHDEQLNLRNVVASEDKQKLSHDYNVRLQEKFDQLDEANKGFKDDVAKRYDRDMRSRESKYSALQAEKIAEALTNKRLRDSDHEKLTANYEEKLSGLRKEREQAIEVAMDKARKSMNYLSDKNNHVLQKTNRDYQTQMDLMQVQNRDDRANMENSYKNMLAQTTQAADKRVRQNFKNTIDVQNELTRFQEERIEQVKNNFRDTISETRKSSIEERRNNIMRMEARLADTVEKYERKLEDQKAVYEAKIKSLETNYRKDINKLNESFGIQKAQTSDAHKLDTESKELKYQGKMAQLEETHKKEVDRIQKRHQEEIGNLLSRMEYYQQKKG